MSELKHVTIRMPEKLLQLIDNWSIENNVSRSAAINYLLSQKMADELRVRKLYSQDEVESELGIDRE